MRNTSLKIKKNIQKYFKRILELYPHISGGRKNYTQHYSRIVKNLLLSKYFKMHFKEKTNKYLLTKLYFKDKKNSMSIKW